MLTIDIQRLTTLLGTEGQSDVRGRLAVADLAATGRDTVGPADLGAGAQGRNHLESVAREGITEDIRQVIPDSAAVQSVGKVGLGAAVVQAILAGGDLQSDATGRGIEVQGLRVGSTWVDGLAGPNRAANRPEVDGSVASVNDSGMTNSAGERGQSGDGGNGSGGETHGWLILLDRG